MKQTESGKALEFQLATEFARFLNIPFTDSPEKVLGENYYNRLDEKEQYKVQRACNEASTFLICHDERFKKATCVYLQPDKVGKQGDVITHEIDEQMWQAAWAIRDKQEHSITGDIPQNKFDAIGLFIYNEGIGQFMGSTLRKMIKADINDINIPSEFQKWIYEKINGVETIMGGLVLRRGTEIAFWLGITRAEVALKWPLLKYWMDKENLTA